MVREIGSEPLAHLDEKRRAHLLIEHLIAVGNGADGFAPFLEMGPWARLAGLWHDLGKYAREFQKRIREANGFEYHLEVPSHLERDHSTAGAVLAERHGPAGLAIAFAIAGHHAGLADRAELRARLQRKAALLDRALADGAPPSLINSAVPPTPALFRDARDAKDVRRIEMWTRMLFSALCDADFLDTECFLNEERASHRSEWPGLDELSRRLRAHLDQKATTAPPSEVNRVRAEVLAACLTAGAQAPGFFSLTVPTGGGKTLAAMAFALEHARRHGLSRVIVAVPYTAILEQSVAAYRAAFGSDLDAVVEHHSALDPRVETLRNRVASENWDAPVVVTTTVQLFESLFGNRPGRCRKLHNLARSVVVLDEAQALPSELLLPILDGLKTLVRDYGVTVVNATATQPALGVSSVLPEGLEDVREIVPAAVRAFERLRRVRVRWPKDTKTPTPYDALADELLREADVLAIVHRRADAQSLCRTLDERLGQVETVHLSALMCPEHRSERVKWIKAQKARGVAVRVVSTQLVEAGVDLDFRVVYRALGGLDSLAQAAGRCNREGRLQGLGELRVFVAPTAPPRGLPAAALAIASGMLTAEPELDLFAPDVFSRYFERLYGQRDLDARQIQEARGTLLFRTVAERFRMVDDAWSEPIVVPWGEARQRLRELETHGPSRNSLRALQQYTVNVRKTDRERWLAAGFARWVSETVVALGEPFATAYDPRFGLVPERVGVAADPAAFIVED